MSQNARPSLNPIRSILGRRPRTPDPSTVASVPAGANVQPSKKKFDAGWGALRESLKIVERCSDLCLPLKAAVGGLLGVMEYVEKIKDAHDELIAIASKIEALSGILTRYANGVPAHISQRLDALGNAINVHTAMIDAKKQRGLLRRILEASGDGQDILRAFRDISFLVDVFIMHTSLSTENAVNQAARDALLDKLQHVPDAEFDRGDRTACMEGTREALLSDIVTWALDRKSPAIFWLDGMAGTGKTTIAESFCRILNSKGILAGSFFCWRTGSAARRSARHIFPSLAVSCSRAFPAFAESLTDLLAKDRDAAAFSLAPQFETLFEKPLQRAFRPDMPIPVLVIDALDECEDAEATSILIDIILKKASSYHVKFFLTSRPEARIRTKFADPHSPLHSVLRLHDIEKSVISADIERYYRQRLGSIPGLILDGLSPSAREGSTVTRLEDIVHRANGLFIYAFTTCEYITSVTGDPRSRLDNLLIGQKTSRKAGQQLDNHYAFIMNEAISQHDETEIADMKFVLCCIVFGREKFTVSGAVRLLGISSSRVRTSLLSLHSVLHVPSEKAAPHEDDDFRDGVRVKNDGEFIRVNHASFGEYLTDSSRSGGEPWFLDACYAHEYLLTRCLDMLNSRLCFNMSGSVSPHTARGKQYNHLESALTYACRFWAEHFSMLLSPQLRSSDILGFLQTKFLYWLEVLYMTDWTWADAKAKLMKLLRILNADESDLVQFLHMALDMINFADSEANRTFSKEARQYFIPGPQHIYLSVLPSLQDNCGIKKLFRPLFRNTVTFCDSILSNIMKHPIFPKDIWKASAADSICSMAISPDGKIIVSGSKDGRIRLWNAQTGHSLCPPVVGHGRAVESLAFSDDGTMIVSGSPDKTLMIWDANEIRLLGPPLLCSGWFIALSPDGKKIACPTSSHAIEIIDVHERMSSGPILVGHTDSINCVAFSSQDDTIVSGSDDGTLRIWTLHAEEVQSVLLEGHAGAVTSVAVSPDGQMLASGSVDCSIRIWDAHTHQPRGDSLEGHTGPVYSVTFSAQGALVISGSADRTVRVWNVGTGALFCEPLEGHGQAITSVAVTTDGQTIVSQSTDGTIRLWDAPIETIGSFCAIHEIQSDIRAHDTSLLSWPFQLELGPQWSRRLDIGQIENIYGQIILWVPSHARHRLMTPRTRLILGADAIYLDFSRFKHGKTWTECYTPNEDDPLNNVPSEIKGLPVYGPRHFDIDLDSEC